MDPDIIIREIGIDEIDTLRDLAEEAFRSSKILGSFNFPILKRSWVFFLKHKIGVLFGLFKNQEIQGVFAGSCYPDSSNGELLAVENHWYVKKDSRGNGILLLAEFEKWAKRHGCQKVRLQGLADAKSVQKVFLRYGYNPIQVTYEKELDHGY